MTRASYVVLGFLVVLSACTERLVCPAYQSAYIYDKNELRKKFSYFQEDSTPKIFTASKTKYLIAEPTPYRKKLRSLQTVASKKVLVAVPDSLSGEKKDSVITADLDRAARSVMDTTMIVDVPQDTVKSDEDSTYVISKDKEVRVLKYNMPDSLEYDVVSNKYIAQRGEYYVDEVGFNTEQDNYMWYLRHSLVLPDVRIAKMQNGKSADKKDVKGKKQKKGVLGFIQKLFRKKKTDDIDSAELAIPPKGEHDFDYIDTTQQVAPDEDEKSRVQEDVITPGDEPTEETLDESTPKSDRRRKKKKEKDPAEDQPADEPKKEEQRDDGF